MYIGSTLSFLFIYLNLFYFVISPILYDLLYFSVHCHIDSRGMKISFFSFSKIFIKCFSLLYFLLDLKFIFPLQNNTVGKGIQKNIYFCFMYYVKAFDHVDHNKLWKILKEMRIPGHHICLLRILYAGKEAAVRTGHGTTDWFQIGKGIHQELYMVTLLI